MFCSLSSLPTNACASREWQSPTSSWPAPVCFTDVLSHNLDGGNLGRSFQNEDPIMSLNSLFFLHHGRFSDNVDNSFLSFRTFSPSFPSSRISSRSEGASNEEFTTRFRACFRTVGEQSMFLTPLRWMVGGWPSTRYMSVVVLGNLHKV